MPATPDVFFDGTDHVVGAGDSLSAYNDYKPLADAHYIDASKAIVSARFDVNPVSLTGTVTVDVEVAPGETIGTPDSCSVRAALYEDNIFACCEPHTLYKNWNYIGRMLVTDKTLTASTSGQTQQVIQAFALDPSWDVTNLHVVAWVQRNTNKATLQAAQAQHHYDCSLTDLDPFVAETNGAPSDFDVALTYTGGTSDDVILTLDESALPVGWDAEIVWNSTTYASTVTIPAMVPSQVENVTVHVIPGGGPGLGIVDLDAHPASNQTNAVGAGTTYQTFHQTPSILFVDDDTGAGSEALFEAAVLGSGHFSVTSEVDVAGNPSAALMSNYDVVIWNTGELPTGTIGTNPQAEIIAYLDGGGSFFLTSQGYLNHRGINSFTTGYLGVASFTSNVGATNLVGVALDPIGDGLAFTDTPPFTNAADAVVPASGAVAWLTSGANNFAVRKDSGVFRSVFMTAPFEGLAGPDADLVMQRVLDWLAPSTATGVTPVAASVSRKLELAQNAPNPFRGNTTVRFAVPTSGRATVTVFDVAGRKVADLLDRPLDAGTHSVVWDGRDSGGSRVASGVYLVRLNAGGETASREIVRVK